jgi:SAM-dependent methyltransferase
MSEECKSWFDASYARHGFAAQRLYPNEELLRFFGRHYFPLSSAERGKISVLEVGCGSGANLWMVAREGFDAHGIDLSPEAIKLCREMLAHWRAEARVLAASMTAMPYPNRQFDVIMDVFSAYCLDERGFGLFLDEVGRLLRPGGRFFSYTPSKGSDAFRNPGNAGFIDGSTLDGIRREDSAYFGSPYPFRFISSAEVSELMEGRGLSVVYNEVVGRTYRRGGEYFEFVVTVAERRD